MYKVAIRKNETGEVVMTEHDLEWTDGSEFWWTFGNMGCDCNRRLCFDRAKGIEIDPEAVECGETEYSALYAELEDGTKIPLEDWL